MRGQKMKSLANALFHINEKEIPIYYDKDTEKINLFFGSGYTTLPDNLDAIVTQELGVLCDGYILYKLSVPLSNDHLFVDSAGPKNAASGTQIRDVEFFIEKYRNNTVYREMRMQFFELDCFIPSRYRAVFANQIVFLKETESLYNFEINYKGKNVSISFETRIEANSKYKTTASTISELVVKFPETSDLEYLIGLYIRIRNFFSFVCNRQNISLRNATLIGSYVCKGLDDNNQIVDETARTEQKIYFSQKYLEPIEEPKKAEKVLNIRYFANHLSTLFQLFFEKDNEENALVNSSSIHHSFKYRNLIDLEQSLHITATFEYYTRTILPEISSQSTIDFIEDMKNLVDQYIEGTTGKKKSKAQKFKRSLKPQISLEEKILKVYNGYGDWSPLSNVLSELFGDDISAFAKAANDWRNELAHEKRTYHPDINVIHAIRLVEHLNYCIVLRHAEYTDDEIKYIISELLAR